MGKSTVAAAYASVAPGKANVFLLVEFNESSYICAGFAAPRFLRASGLGFRADGFGMGWPPASARGFAVLRENLRGWCTSFSINRAMKSLVDVAPGLKELALMGKVTSGVRGIGPAMPYDEVVVDAFATGHFKVLVDIPRAMGGLIHRGRWASRAEASTEFSKILRTPGDRGDSCRRAPDPGGARVAARLEGTGIESCFDRSQSRRRNFRIALG